MQLLTSAVVPKPDHYPMSSIYRYCSMPIGVGWRTNLPALLLCLTVAVVGGVATMAIAQPPMSPGTSPPGELQHLAQRPPGVGGPQLMPPDLLAQVPPTAGPQAVAEPPAPTEPQPEVVPPVVRPLRRRKVFSRAEIVPSDETQAKVDALISEVLLPEATLDLDLNESKLIRMKRPVARISITDPSIVEIVQYGPTEFELVGSTNGHTTLTLWYGEADEELEVLRYLVRVSDEESLQAEEDLEFGDLEDRINELFPNSAVQLIPVLDKLIVRGQARDASDAGEILSILSGQAIDQSGALLSSRAILNLGQVAQAPGIEDLPAQTLINLLEVPGERQIMLKVRVAELTRSALRDMGVNFQLTRGEFSLSSIFTGGGPFEAILNTDEVTLVLNAIAANTYSKVLAEPNLVTLNGQPASFVAGGQFAVPTVVGISGAAAGTTRFQSFGTQIFFTPAIVDKDRIRLSVTPTFSTVNSGLAVNGIPGLNTRTVSATVDLREGQWLALAGLLQDTQAGGESRVPLLGDLPGLGLLFSSRNIDREETELIILVSPEIVHALEPEEVPLLLPGMEVTEPDNWDFFVHGRPEGDFRRHFRSTVWPLERERILAAHREALAAARKQTRYQECQEYYIQGPVGFSQ